MSKNLLVALTFVAMAIPAVAAEQVPPPKPRAQQSETVPLPLLRPAEAPEAKTGENLFNVIRFFLVRRVYVARPRYYAPRRHYASRPKQQQASRTSSPATRTVKNDEPSWAK